MKISAILTTLLVVIFSTSAMAASNYDGAWDLNFVTRTGACDPTYNFGVNIRGGLISHPNLVRFQGRVARTGAVRASVTVQDKFASGVGRLSNDGGRGTWTGRTGASRCSGFWTAQKNY